MQAARLFRSVAAAAVVVASAAIAAAAADFTIPPTPDHYVVDAAGALRSATASALESELRAFEHATGHQVVVSIADTTGGVSLETYTAQTAHAWRIGRKGKDDGAVLFVFVQDRKVRIEVGYGLESALTDAASDQIIQTVIVPRMRAGTSTAPSSAASPRCCTVSIHRSRRRRRRRRPRTTCTPIRRPSGSSSSS